MPRNRFDPDIPAWERQPSESSVAWQAWTLYRDMQGRRSVTTVARSLGKSRTLITRWCSPQVWNWVERSRAYDNHVDAMARQKQIRDVIAYRERAAQQSRGAAQTMMLASIAISQRLAKGQATGLTVEQMFEKVTMEDLVFLATKSGAVLPHLLKAEALALGEATERAETTVLPTDELTKKIEDSADLRAAAALLIERAGATTHQPGS